MKDKEILSLLWQRSEQAISALANRFGNGLQTLAMNILGNPADAEEAVNDTYLALWNAIPPQRPDPLAPYVYRTGRNQALKKLRSLTAQKRDGRYDLCLEELAEILPGGTVEELLDAKTLGAAINSFLARQNKENRVLFVRRYWFGDSVAVLAKSTHLSAGIISTRLSRMRTALRTHLEKEEIYL